MAYPKPPSQRITAAWYTLICLCKETDFDRYHPDKFNAMELAARYLIHEIDAANLLKAASEQQPQDTNAAHA